MRSALQSEDRELLLDLFGKAHTINLRLQDLSDQLDLGSDVQLAIQSTAYKANTLLASLSTHLID